MRSLMLGGARSGKSRLAEACLLASAGERPVHYIATADARLNDQEMADRIAHHQAHRAGRWTLHEVPLGLGEHLNRLNVRSSCVLVDCLTLWLTNALMNGSWPAERQAFMAAVEGFQGELVLVSNEVGMGIVPLGEFNRCFVDESGRLHQQLAGLCEKVTFVAAGLPLVMKG